MKHLQHITLMFALGLVGSLAMLAMNGCEREGTTRIDSPTRAFEFTYDGCQYISFPGFNGMVHKGNCTNCIHRQ